MSLVLRTQSVSCKRKLLRQILIWRSSFLLQLASVEQQCELNEKSEQVQQANMFKHQTLMFHF